MTPPQPQFEDYPPHPRRTSVPCERRPAEQRRRAQAAQDEPPGGWWDDAVRALEDTLSDL